jgi:Na+-translocating ferredoxin:NAD+ oxidoreductase RNF subunit RnfB
MALQVIVAFIVVGALGALFGIGLAFASRVLAVQKDERVQEVEEALPGLNCGACGYAGCAAYAEAVATQDEVLTLCTPGGADAAQRLGQIMGKEVDLSGGKMVTQVHCRGGRDVTTYEFDYHGMTDCNALFLLYGGDKVCKEGCLQLGSCIRVCPVDAISYDDEGKVWVDRDICISCGKCVDICPTGVMKWVPYEADYIVACNNTDTGKRVRKYCKVGCIACKICEKQSPEGGYVVENNLSTLDYSNTGERTKAAKKCPPKCIIRTNAPLQTPEPEVQSAQAASPSQPGE